MNDKAMRAEAVAVANGRILAVGSRDAVFQMTAVMASGVAGR